ncbi:MAG: leucine-rich repeat domain-containing protein [Gemmatimonadota bacterium]|nr:leucine-rich repeat domain-containing protein [Gemmatimonadota bacterium]
MLCFVLFFVLCCVLSCSKEQPPTAPAGKATDDDCTLCDFFGALQDSEDSNEDTASDSSSVSSPDSSSVSSSSDSSPSNGIFIPDTALRTYIEKELNKNPGETITQADMNTLTILWDGNSLGIKNLRGLETANNLTKLRIQNNAISDLTPLADLTRLDFLWIGLNQVSDLTPLVNLTRLRSLLISINQVTDITPLQNLTRLIVLGVGNNQVSDLTPLANLSKLQRLYLHNNHISDFTPLANLTDLESLDISSNQVSDLDLTPLANLSKLYNLFIGYNQVSDLTPLVNLTRLGQLEFPDNQVSDLMPLANLSNLRNINLDWNNVSDISPLIALPHLFELNARGNPLSEASINEHIPVLKRRNVILSFSSLTETPFSLDLVFLDDFTEWEQDLWYRIAKRWEAAILNDLPDYEFSDTWSGECGEHSIEIPAGEQIDDLRIYVTKYSGINSYDQHASGYGGPRLLRSNSLPIIGCIGIDQELSDVWLREVRGLHEIGHVLGIGTIWHDSGMLRGLNADTHFAGPQAIAAFDQAGGTKYQGAKVPTEQDGAHWRNSVLPLEIMSPFIDNERISSITLGALSDLGYSVELSAADPYSVGVSIGLSTAAKPVADEVPFCSLEGLPPPVYVDD